MVRRLSPLDLKAMHDRLPSKREGSKTGTASRTTAKPPTTSRKKARA
jgi:hypothetical protein